VLTIELSGEIKMAHPDKNVTIIHGGKLPLSSIYPEHFREKVVGTLKKYGVDIILNEQVDLSKTDGKTVHLSSGKVMNTDVVVLSFMLCIKLTFSSSQPVELPEVKSSKHSLPPSTTPKPTQSKSNQHFKSPTINTRIFSQQAT